MSPVLPGPWTRRSIAGSLSLQRSLPLQPVGAPVAAQLPVARPRPALRPAAPAAVPAPTDPEVPHGR